MQVSSCRPHAIGMLWIYQAIFCALLMEHSRPRTRAAKGVPGPLYWHPNMSRGGAKRCFRLGFDGSGKWLSDLSIYGFGTAALDYRGRSERCDEGEPLAAIVVRRWRTGERRRWRASGGVAF